MTQKNISKTSDDMTTEKGIRLSIDITSSKQKSLGDNKYWVALMDEGTEMLWCVFLTSKDERCDASYKHIMKMKG